MSAKKTIEGFRVPWSVRFFLRRGDPHVLPAFLKVSRLIDKSSRREDSVKSTTLKGAELELVERAYAGGDVKNSEMARLGSLWDRVSRRKQGRLYAMMMIKMMLNEGASRKNTLLLSKLLQMEKEFWSGLFYFCYRHLSRYLSLSRYLAKYLARYLSRYLARYLAFLVLSAKRRLSYRVVFRKIVLKTGLGSFLLQSRILGRIYSWAQLRKYREKLKENPSWKFLNTLFFLFHIWVGRASLKAYGFVLDNYDFLKNPNTPPHLGGHGGVTHSDEGALIFLKKRFSVKSMMDIGCSTGGQVDMARRNGIEAFGVDGDSSLKFSNPWFFIHDFTKGNFDCKRRFDLVWCVEFLEHVDEKYQPFYMSLFQRADVVVCTAAPPGQIGYHHVNCRELSYWIKVFKKYGFAFDVKNTERLKKVSNMQEDFIRQRGMLFVKHH